ncbi:MAG: DNA protecting protein DprA [Bacteroidetes bacterium 4572_117]|nr:MAG: DNA protecting protein DprA [Bacteroidetes bacterium 4572_117]
MGNDLRDKIAFSLIPGIGNANSKKLIAHFGNIKNVFGASKNELLKVPGIGPQLANEILDKSVFDYADEEVGFVEKNKIDVYFLLDKNYPERLKHCEDSPVILYFKGTCDLNRQKVLSIVGTRNATQYGKDRCNELVKGLSSNGHNPLIVSGLAYGVDVCAHKAAIKNGLSTIGVLGHGLQMMYPASHRQAARDIINSGGGLLTEFSSKSKLDPSNFVKRNRIIAGMADATIVVESGQKGGSLITADIANSYNRDVFAFPGRVNDKQSIGCNRLIKTNRAALIENVSDLEYILGWEKESDKKIIQKQLFVELNPDEQIVLDVLKSAEALSVDVICLKSNFPMSKVSSILLKLEFSGMVKSMPGKIYGLG